MIIVSYPIGELHISQWFVLLLEKNYSTLRLILCSLVSDLPVTSMVFSIMYCRELLCCNSLIGELHSFQWSALLFEKSSPLLLLCSIIIELPNSQRSVLLLEKFLRTLILSSLEITVNSYCTMSVCSKSDTKKNDRPVQAVDPGALLLTVGQR